MKFKINTNDLIAKLNIVSRVQKKGTASMISNIKFTILDNGILQIVTNDGDMEISTSLPVSEVEAGSFCVGNEQFMKMLKGIPNQDILLTCDDKTYAIVIKYQNGKFKMTGVPSSEYISINFKESDGMGIEVESQSLLTSLTKTKICVADKDILRPVFTSIHLIFAKEGLSVCSTDCHSLMYCFRENNNEENSNMETQTINMPVKAADILSSIIAQSVEDGTTFFINDTHAEIIVGTFNLKTRLIDGDFPNFKAVIPTDNDIHIEFNRKDLIGALRRVINFADTTSNLVEIVGIKDDSYYLTSENIDMALSAKEMLRSNTAPEEFKIGFRGDVLLNILNVFNDEVISIDAKSADKPILIKSDEEIHTECVIMPMMIK